jgi:multidrug efflux pump subunit AcrA (membrane-fusion protein)
VNRAASLILLMTAIGLGGALTGCGAKPGAAETVRDTAPGSIKVTGELRSADSRFFGPPSISDIWQYTISYMAPDGSRVEAGKPILGFNTQELEVKIRDKGNLLNQKRKELQKQEILARETLAENRLAIEEARAQVDKAALRAEIPENLLARRDYLENQLLFEQASLNLELRQAELEKETRLQETEAEILRQDIAVLDADIAVLQKSIDTMSIAAPTDGVVIHVIGRHGEKLAVGDNVWGSRRVIEFPDLQQLEVALEVPERESARISKGQAVSFTLDAAPDQVFRGRVRELASVIRTRSTNQPAKVMDAIVELDNPDPDLMRPGMSVNADILP